MESYGIRSIGTGCFCLALCFQVSLMLEHMHCRVWSQRGVLSDFHFGGSVQDERKDSRDPSEPGIRERGPLQERR